MSSLKSNASHDARGMTTIGLEEIVWHSRQGSEEFEN